MFLIITDSFFVSLQDVREIKKDTEPFILFFSWSLFNVMRDTVALILLKPI